MTTSRPSGAITTCQRKSWRGCLDAGGGAKGGKRIHALDFIMILLSFVYAAAVTHLLATAGDIAIAFKRVNFSWLNAGWMAVSLLTVAAWWIGLWDLRGK